MATYYRWRKSTINRTIDSSTPVYSFASYDGGPIIYTLHSSQATVTDSGEIELHNPLNSYIDNDGRPHGLTNQYHMIAENGNDYNAIGKPCYLSSGAVVFNNNGTANVQSGELFQCKVVTGPGTSQGYVYSTSSSTYPNGGVSGSYYYDQRTTVTSPTAPTGLTYPNPITTPSVSLSWTAATSATSYPVNRYEVSYSTNGTSWVVAGTMASTSYSFSVTPGTTSITFRVRARDTNGQWGGYTTGTASQVLLAPTLTVPQMVMQGQQATISWSAIEGADSYTLQRKSSADADWTQVYSGANLSYTDTVGTWTSLQYRVQAVFDGTAGGWATSDPIQIVSASALVISGTDGDLGTLVNDVPYSISSDQTSPTIDVTVEVNGGEYAAFQATSGQTYKVGVLDLPTGTGSIVITATTEVSSSPVTVTRTWTYSKTAQTFPNSGSVATLTKEGNVVYPETLIEAVRASMPPWGGNLSTALNLLKNAALFNRTKQPKYSEVTISLSGKTEGQTIQLPEGGKMVEFYVSKLNYEEGLNGTGRVLMVRKDCYDQREWDSGNVNAYATSDIDAWMNGDYKALFPEEIQTAMGTTEFYYTPGNGNNTVGTMERAVFQLSATELGKTDSGFNVEGSALPIASALQIAHLNGNAITQWTRSPDINGANLAFILLSSGDITNSVCTWAYGTRPSFTLPSTFTATYYVDTQGTIHDQQEYTEAGDWLDVWGNAIPAVKMETGSYVGTGTSGSSNPNTLTFPFEPQMVFVSSSQRSYSTAPMLRNSSRSSTGTSTSNLDITVQWTDNGVSWYASTIDHQLNYSGTTYYYIALG